MSEAAWTCWLGSSWASYLVLAAALSSSTETAVESLLLRMCFVDVLRPVLKLPAASLPSPWEAVTGRKQASTWSPKSSWVLSVYLCTANFTSLSFPFQAALMIPWGIGTVFNIPSSWYLSGAFKSLRLLPISTFSYKPALNGSSWSHWESATVCLSQKVDLAKASDCPLLLLDVTSTYFPGSLETSWDFVQILGYTHTPTHTPNTYTLCKGYLALMCPGTQKWVKKHIFMWWQK